MVRCRETARECDDRIEVTNEARKRPTKRRSSGRRRRSPAAAAIAPPPVEPLQLHDEPLVAPPAPIALASPAEPEPPFPDDLALDTPEVEFAQRVAARPPEPERPWPARRRVVFFDVENTSRMQHIGRVIDHLALDRVGTRTDFIAVGNWRVIGHDTGRLLARHGAQLVHSAPAVGVRDWSDLRIAVAAGVWLGAARPGDLLEIVSDDRAFDAVGDVATSLGIAFRRLSYRGLTDQPRAVEVAPEPVAITREAGSGDRRGGRYRRGRGGRGRYDRPAPMPAMPSMPAPPAAESGVEPHTAPHDELLGVARDLIYQAPARTVTLDTLANALKARGFSRPPGSPRLITRLRRIRELQINRAGQITLVESESAPPPPPPPVSEPVSTVPPRGPSGPPPMRPAPAPAPRTYEQRRAEVEAALRGEIVPAYVEPAMASSAPVAEPVGDDPGEDSPAESAAPSDAPRRRRSRRGGRRRRRHGAPAAG
jgi:hypothetical protein